MFSFDVKTVKFENPNETWFQVMVVKYIFGIPYSKSYHSTGYGEHEKPIKYDTYEKAKNDNTKLYKKLKVMYHTKTVKTILD
jgi:hypothetical protein